jgi:hypothetical protein
MLLFLLLYRRETVYLVHVLGYFKVRPCLVDHLRLQPLNYEENYALFALWYLPLTRDKVQRSSSNCIITIISDLTCRYLQACSQNMNIVGAAASSEGAKHTYICNKTNKMHTFFINDLIRLYCLRHVSNIQVFILRKTCTCSFMVFFSCIHISSLVDGRMFYTFDSYVYTRI